MAANVRRHDAARRNQNQLSHCGYESSANMVIAGAELERDGDDYSTIPTILVLRWASRQRHRFVQRVEQFN